MPQSDPSSRLRTLHLRIRRVALAALVVLVGACSFEPGQQPSFAAPDGGANNVVADGGANNVVDDGGSAFDVGNGGGGSDAGVADGGAMDGGAADGGAADGGGVDAGVDGGVDGGQMPAECGGETVDLSRNPDHCGACGNACDPDFGRCVAGECGCEAGLTPCGADGRCTATDYDPDDCGACGNACDVGEACVGGQCACRAGLSRCDGACVDPQSDPRHCGGCGTSCGDGSCSDGNCRGTDRCSPATILACAGPDGGEACIRDETNPLHCGSNTLDPCGTPCDADEVCVDPGLLAAECESYRVGRGCTGCPCDDCEADETCFTSETAPGQAFCLDD